ncbi:unnamed protein product [Haemonchus placei]|uniref:RT_RNaseH_2 domain-containing protein n=1 Tax=Haemonchus placei TaxID=6290 RepID=A0A0N4WA74_HAEPC|nr:unnamed protein product [Haemonchus placei]
MDAKKMLKKKSLLVQEVKPGSSSFEEYQRHCGEGSSTPSVILVAVDKSETPAGFCGLAQDKIFLKLELFIKAKADEESIAPIALVNMALKISRKRFPDSVVMIDSKMKNVVHLENLGQASTDSALRRLMPLEKSFGHLQTFKFVPLAWLQHLMDARKLGESIITIFVQLSIAVQRGQEDVAVHSPSSSDLQNEAFLLDFAWDRLNTGR